MSSAMSSAKQSFKVCFFFRRKFRTRAAEPPEDVRAVFRRYSENGIMSVDQMQRFLTEVQGEEKATKENAQAIFNSLNHLNIFHRRGLHLEAFLGYLLGDLNLPLPPSGLAHQDMTAPLSHYYIYTGHNSYLTGNQLSSDSSVVPIIKALKKGVRVIELDLWPNSKRNNVEVLHGGTLTTPVELIKCLRAIKENAFVASEYPVVITFEDHLTQDLQSLVARMVTKIFGDTLYRPDSDCLREFPSPESLKKKVMISTKPPKEYLETPGVEEKRSAEKHKQAAEDEVWGTMKTIRKGELEITNEVEADDEEDDEENGGPEYKRLIAIHAGKPKGGWKNSFNDLSSVRRLSLSEQEHEEAVQIHGSDIVRFTQRNLLRVYPKGTRLDSSNYNPLLAWMHGAQMVAFNMQGHGKYLWIMEGMFRANGGCGYVKKPDFLLAESPNNEVFNPKAKLPVKIFLKVKIYMGQGWNLDFGLTHFDRYSPPDFFTRVGIAGVPCDTTHMKKTKTIEDEWIPVWNEEFEFPLSVPELALLRIEVLEYDTSGTNDFGGQTCLPVSELRTGIRAVALNNRRGEQYKNVKLLMRFDFI